MFDKLIMAGSALLIATPAMARPTTNLVVDNDWQAPVTVEVDGRFVGTLGAFQDGRFRVRSGYHTVNVYSMNGTLLECADQWFVPRRTAHVQVDTPMTTVTVVNKGTTPLFVSGPRAGLWISPGQSQTATVPAGNLSLTASVNSRHGRMTQVDSERIWAEPGRRNTVAFDYSPLPTRLLVHNAEPMPIHVYLDGRSMGMLSPGRVLTLETRPGRHELDAFTRSGRMVFDGTVRVAHRSDTRVKVFRDRPAPPPPTRAPTRERPLARPASTAQAPRERDHRGERARH